MEFRDDDTGRYFIDSNHDMEDHGIGTRSVLNFINKTDSEIRYIAEEKTFKARMLVS